MSLLYPNQDVPMPSTVPAVAVVAWMGAALATPGPPGRRGGVAGQWPGRRSQGLRGGARLHQPRSAGAGRVRAGRLACARMRAHARAAVAEVATPVRSAGP